MHLNVYIWLGVGLSGLDELVLESGGEGWGEDILTLAQQAFQGLDNLHSLKVKFKKNYLLIRIFILRLKIR